MRQVVSHVCFEITVYLGVKETCTSLYLAAAEPGWHTPVLVCLFASSQLINSPCHRSLLVWDFQTCSHGISAPSAVRWRVEGPSLARGLFCLDLIIKMLVFQAKVVEFRVATVFSEEGGKKGWLTHFFYAYNLIFLFSLTSSAISPIHSTLTTHPSCVSNWFLCTIFLFKLSLAAW